MAHQYLICSSPDCCVRSVTHHPAAEAGAQPRRRLWKDHLRAHPLLGLLVFPGPRGAAPTMLGCPRLALLCALPWLLRAAVPGHPGEPFAQSTELLRDPRDPARAADFDHVYNGVVNLSTEHIYSFNHTTHPGQVRSSVPRLTQTSEIAEPPRYLWLHPG